MQSGMLRDDRRRTSLSLGVFVGLVFLAVTNAALSVYAIPAAPAIHILQQASGYAFPARLWGDEWLHGWETADGYTILFDHSSRNWVYAAKDPAGNLVKTPSIVGIDPPPWGVSKHLRPSGYALQRADQMRTSAIRRGLPSTGPWRPLLPVILINFKDTKTRYSANDFYRLIFGRHPRIASGPGSVRDYYEEVSYGRVSIIGEVVGWFKAKKSHDYYGGNVDGWDAHPRELVREAVLAADKAGVDFSRYDNDGDGEVDGVIVIHQGTGEEASEDESDIWSHRWRLGDLAVKVDGVVVDGYTLQPEILALDDKISTIGVIAHELGHLFGLPDLYDTDYSSQGIGIWGLMGGGSWLKTSRPGDTPAHLMAWCKWVLGWLEPQQVTSSSPETIKIPNIEDHDTAFYLRDNPGGAHEWLTEGCSSSRGEYFILANRQRKGFDAGLPGAGLLIWHIDESRCNNRDETHKLVDLEEADGLNELDEWPEEEEGWSDAGDPYPGTSRNRTFDHSSNPSSDLYSGEVSGVKVRDISNSSMTMTAKAGVTAEGEEVSEERPVTIEVDRGCGLAGSSYRIGETITISYNVSENANVTLYHVGPAPGTRVIFEGYVPGRAKQTDRSLRAEVPGVETVVIKAFTASGRVLTAACSYSVGGVSPQSAQIWIDKGCGSTYRNGERMTISLRVSEAGTIKIIDFLTTGEVADIVERRVYAGETVTIRARVEGPPGIETLVLRATTDSGRVVTAACSFKIP